MLDKLCPIRTVSTNVASSERGFSVGLVGHLFKDDQSDAIFKLVYCSIGDCTAGNLVQVDVDITSGNGYLSVEKCAANGYPIGVAKCTFVSASFGLIQVSGVNSAVLASSVSLPVAGSLVVAGATAGTVVLADLTMASHAARIAGMTITASATACAGVMFVKGIL